MYTIFIYLVRIANEVNKVMPYQGADVRCEEMVDNMIWH